MQKLSTTPIKGILVQGSNGEFASLNEHERLELVAKSREYLSSDKNLLVGSGCEGTLATIDMTNRMAEQGADLAVVITPSYYKGAMDDTKLVHHFLKVADHSKIPIILYNVPKFTNVHLSAAAINTLAQHENVVGMKESDGTCLDAKIPLVEKSENFHLIAGSAGFITKFTQLGGIGSICALGNVLPEQCCELNQTLDADLQEKLKLPNDLVTAKYGIPGLKYAMSLFGYQGGVVREPLLELSQGGKQEIQQVFSEFL